MLWVYSARQTTYALAGLLLLTDLCIWAAHTTGWWPVTIIAFLGIASLPGIAILRISRATLHTFTTNLLYCFGLSILVLMLSGLAANQILPLFGVTRPLELAGLLSIWNIVTALLLGWSAYVYTKPTTVHVGLFTRIKWRSWLLVALCTFLPFLAAFGAFRLNNGGDGLVAVIALCYSALLVLYVFLLRNHLPDGVISWFVFILSLSILLMTSLRGWDIVGHDIEREFRVYSLTQQYAHWDIGLDKDPYNACLSITILPQVLSSFLGISGLIVFKIVLQIMFAACPVVIYILVRRYASKLTALTGTMLFICYPTFINDSAMLTRQGIAYLFFALALFILSNTTQRARYKILFLLCGLGAILSHYSTAYMFVALFAVAVISKFILRRFIKKQSYRRTVLSPLYASLLFLMTFTWYAQITGTSDGLIITLQKSLTNIPQLFSDDNKSADTSTALLFAGGKSQADLYQSYLTHSERTNGTNSQDMPSLIGDAMPLTPLGFAAQKIGIQAEIISILRQNFARVLQVLAVAGVIFATHRLLRRHKKTLRPDFICLGLAGIALLALMVVLPVLSINYGLLRAFQQTLIFLIVPIALLLAAVGRYITPWLRSSIATTSIIVLFLLFTGVFAQILGGNSPSLTLNNQGLYFGLYYAPEADQKAFTWIKEHVPKNQDVRAANFNRAAMHDPKYPFTHPGILPLQIHDNTFVYLDQAQVLTQKFYAYYDSSPLIMSFPLGYYQALRNQIYSTSTTQVYR
jgi:uncharacterized membrane protein